MRENRDGGDTRVSNANGTTLVSYLLGGMAFWGGIGWVADRALGFSALFLPVGLIVGFAGAVYLIYAQHVRS
ncbi:hypothetical protein [Nocardiopsis sp. CNT312]|uniref:AtpZ/AtpI family protein n=1 Tax=Nocardiopsis sp. CNT312 TaxID=1137268 RepID=UPI000491110B|nr:hypothetical protein [Nocardiopsis sp. CNT312]